MVAHRGASSAVAEHTLAAYVSAIESGADALECDVRLTRDGHLVCVHDRTVNRTSDGTRRGQRSRPARPAGAGLHAPGTASCPQSADELLGDSPVSRRGRAGPARRRAAACSRWNGCSAWSRRARPVRLLIETKHPTRYGGLVEKELVDLLGRFGWAGHGRGRRTAARTPADMDNRVVVMSFAPTALRRVKLLAPATSRPCC